MAKPCKLLVTLLVLLSAGYSGIGNLVFPTSGLFRIADAAAAAHVQTTGASIRGGTSLTVNVGATTAGSLLLVGINASGGIINSVTDNKSDALIRATSAVISGNIFAIYYARNVSAGVTSVTVNFPYGDTDIIVAEYSGIDPTAPLDQTAFHDNGYAGGTSYTSSATPPTSQASELAWGFSGNVYSSQPTWAAGSGWTSRWTQKFSFAQEKFLSTQGAYAATGTISPSTDYEIVSLIATFKASAGAGSPPPADTIPPTVSILSPAMNSTLSGMISLTANASDNVAVASVQFKIDGANFGPPLTAVPYTVSWDTTKTANGNHTVTATATDTSGNPATATNVPVTVSNPLPPVISSFSASPATIVSGGASTLSWSVSGNPAPALSIDKGVGSVSGTSISVSPAQTTVYTLTATNSSGVATAMTAVTVNMPSTPGAVNIILDSDIAADADDVGDQALLWALAKNGEAKVMALITSSTNNYSAPATYAIAKYYGHENVPIGAYQGNTPGDYSSKNSYFTRELTNQFGIPGETRANYPDAVTVYRQALAGAPNGSVTIVAGGFYEPLYALLQSRPDSISSLTGLQLVARKVKVLVSAAGWLPDSGDYASHNFRVDADAASYVFANWPTPIVSVGDEVGGYVLTGPAANANPDTNPIKLAYDLYCDDGQWCPNMQYAWTQVAILYAVRGLGNSFTYGGQNGSTVVWDNSQPVPGRNIWSQTPDRQHSYIKRISSSSSLENIINPLIQRAP